MYLTSRFLVAVLVFRKKDHRWHQSMVRTKQWHTRCSWVWHSYAYHILTNSVIYEVMYKPTAIWNLFVLFDEKSCWWWRFLCVCKNQSKWSYNKAYTGNFIKPKGQEVHKFLLIPTLLVWHLRVLPNKVMNTCDPNQTTGRDKNSEFTGRVFFMVYCEL